MAFLQTSDLIGRVFGWLTVKAFAGSVANPRGQYRAAWECTCRCGKTVIVPRTSLLTGNTKSCGCFRLQPENNPNFRHGEYSNGRPSSELHIWKDIMARCTNPNRSDFRYYGGRGIKVCRRWKKFDNFLVDMGRRPSPRHTIDRINSNGNYTPTNCRWATRQEQSHNLRTNFNLTCVDETHCLSEWSRIVKLRPETIKARLRAGYSVDDALFMPRYYTQRKRKKRN